VGIESRLVYGNTGSGRGGGQKTKQESNHTKPTGDYNEDNTTFPERHFDPAAGGQ